MLRLIIMAIFMGGGAYLAFKLWEKAKSLAPPPIPERWGLFIGEGAVASALESRARFILLIKVWAPAQRRAFLLEIHEVIDEIVTLTERSREINSNLNELKGPEIDAFQASAQSLLEEADRGARELNQLYLEMMSEANLQRCEPTGKTQNLLEGLQRQVAAEREIRKSLE